MIRSRWFVGVALAVAAVVLGACGSQWLAGGKLHFDQKRYDRALENFEKAVAEKPQSGEAHLWLGRALAELDRDTEAIAELKKARELDPLQEEMVNNTFISYWSRRYNSALSYAKTGEETQRAGDQKTALEQLAKAEERFSRAVLYAPDSVQNYSNLGKVLYRLGRRDEALTMFHKAKEMSTRRPDLQRFLFHLFKELGAGTLEKPTRDNLQRGLGLLLDAASLPADSVQMAEINLNIASIYRGLADSVSAERKPEMLHKSVEYFDKVLATYPDDPDALEDLAYVYSDLGEGDRAMETAQKRLDQEPWNLDTHMMMYRLQRAAKNDKGANAHFLFIQLMQEGQRQPKEGLTAWAGKEYGPNSDMMKTLRSKGQPEDIRKYSNGPVTFYAWPYWTQGRVYMFQGGTEKFQLSFKPVPREKLPEVLGE
jgi:Flp pilus assembly protein TadD